MGISQYQRKGGNMMKIVRILKKPAIMTTIVTALFAVALIPLTSADSWGPIRETFTYESPSDHVTFNSITNNPDWGDERNFTVVKDLGTAPVNDGATAAGSGFGDTAPAVAGHTYMVKMLVHNNASQNLNLEATNTKVTSVLPTSTATGDIVFQGRVSADNCGITDNSQAGTPCMFYDEAYLTGATGWVSVNYVPGSARYYNNISPFSAGGFTLNDSINTTGGALVGYENMDGDLLGCSQYLGYATFLITVEADQPSFTLDKYVRLKTDDNSEPWTKEITAQPGDEVEYQIKYNNVGTDDQTGVIISDLLPTGVDYVDDSAMLYDSANPLGTPQQNEAWLEDGWIIGTFSPNTEPGSSSAVIEFSATLPGEDELFCAENLLQNFAIAFTPDAGNKMSNADVTINIECEETPPGPSDTGFGLPTSATLSLVAFLGLAGAVVTVIVLQSRKSAKK
jgi:uncharacterized repeat protein (TIGR01451 family)